MGNIMCLYLKNTLPSIMRLVVSAAIINDKKELLLVQKKTVWILPGGKPEESDLGCLVREVSEEIEEGKVTNCRFYKAFQGIAPFAGDGINVDVYFAELQNLGKPQAEISDAAYATYEKTRAYPLSDVTKQVVESLKQDGYL